MTITEFFEDTARAQEYRNWLALPMTRAVIEQLKELSPPLPLNETGGPQGSLSERALYHHGFHIGQDTTLRLLSGLDAVNNNLKTVRKTLQPDYGART